MSDIRVHNDNHPANKQESRRGKSPHYALCLVITQVHEGGYLGSNNLEAGRHRIKVGHNGNQLSVELWDGVPALWDMEFSSDCPVRLELVICHVSLMKMGVWPIVWLHGSILPRPGASFDLPAINLYYFESIARDSLSLNSGQFNATRYTIGPIQLVNDEWSGRIWTEVPVTYCLTSDDVRDWDEWQPEDAEWLDGISPEDQPRDEPLSLEQLDALLPPPFPTKDSIVGKFAERNWSRNGFLNAMRSLVNYMETSCDDYSNYLPLNLLDTIVSSDKSDTAFAIINDLTVFGDLGMNHGVSTQSVTTIVRAILDCNIVTFDLDVEALPDDADDFIIWVLGLVDFACAKLAREPLVQKAVLENLWNQFAAIVPVYTVVRDHIRANPKVTPFAYLFLFELMKESSFDEEYASNFAAAFTSDVEGISLPVANMIDELSIVYESIERNSIVPIKFLRHIDRFALFFKSRSDMATDIRRCLISCLWHCVHSRTPICEVYGLRESIDKLTEEDFFRGSFASDKNDRSLLLRQLIFTSHQPVVALELLAKTIYLIPFCGFEAPYEFFADITADIFRNVTRDTLKEQITAIQEMLA